MAAVSLESPFLLKDPYLERILASNPNLRARPVVVLDTELGKPIQAEIIASRVDASFISYELRDRDSKESYGRMLVSVRAASSVYISTLRNLRRGYLKGVGNHLLDQAFLVAERHGLRHGKLGMRVSSFQTGKEPDPAPFYLKYGFRPTHDTIPKYGDVWRVTKALRELSREDPQFDQAACVKRAKAILAAESGQPNSTEELFEKWYWDRDTQPTIVLSQKILELARCNESIDMIVDMHLPDAAILAIRKRLASIK
jgi:hypothetical protein